MKVAWKSSKLKTGKRDVSGLCSAVEEKEKSQKEA